jgi:hypothetical protein
MVTTELKTILAASGCTLVIYEQDKLANLYTDRSDNFDVIGVINQLNTVDLEVKANAIIEHYNPLYIDIVQQVRLEDKAEHNEAALQMLLDICKEVIVRLIAEASYKTLMPVTVVKVLETKYDANVIGWTIPLNLYYLKNENRNPCLQSKAAHTDL